MNRFRNSEYDAASGQLIRAYLWGAAGLVGHVEPGSAGAGGAPETFTCESYTFDPSGNAVTENPYPGKNLAGTHPQTTFICAATFLYDAFGTNGGPGTVPTGAWINDPGANPEDPVGTNPIGYKGQFGCYTDYESGYIYCQQRYYSPSIGRWILRDPIGLDGGVNAYEFCGNNPVTGADPSGLDWQDSKDWFFSTTFGQLFVGENWGTGDDKGWQTGSYLGDVWEVFKGEGRAVNPVLWVKNLYNAGSYMNHKGWLSGRAWLDMGGGFVNGLAFWNKDKLGDMGESFMGDVLLATPLLKKIPNFTRFKIKGPFRLPNVGGATLPRMDNVLKAPLEQRFRLDWHELPNKPSIPKFLRGKSVPHFHTRGKGGMKIHRPWEK